MQVTGAAYSHDGNRIAFGEADHTPAGDQLAIVVLNLADGTRRVVARDVVGAAVFQEFGRPRWSADDGSLAFFVADWDPPTADTPRRTYIALVSVDGSDVDSPRSVVGLPAFASYPDLNPLEDRLIFDTRDEAWFHDGSSNIYSVRPDGSELTLLTDFLRPGERAVHPTFSADGSQILYTTFGLDGWPHLSVMNSDGSAPTVLDVAGMHPRLQPAP